MKTEKPVEEQIEYIEARFVMTCSFCSTFLTLTEDWNVRDFSADLHKAIEVAEYRIKNGMIFCNDNCVSDFDTYMG